jgi:hypothetical protein
MDTEITSAALQRFVATPFLLPTQSKARFARG